MTSRYLPVEIAFLILALFTVSWQCAAQCLAQRCDQLGAKLPPCHRHPSTNHEAPSSCKASLLLAEEVRSQSADGAGISAGILPVWLLPNLGGHNPPAPQSGGQVSHGPKAPPASGTELKLPLRI